MTNIEKALLFGACMGVLYLAYTDPDCNRACKQLIAGIIRTGMRQLI